MKKKILAIGLSLALVFGLATPVSATINPAQNPTDGYEQTVITNATAGTTLTICEGQKATTAEVNVKTNVATGTAIVTVKDNLVIETNNSNVTVTDNKVAVKDANGIVQGYAHYLTFIGQKAATTPTTVTCYKDNIASANVLSMSAISGNNMGLTASYTAQPSVSATFTVYVQGHTVATSPKVDSTFTTVGHTEYSYCSVCHKVITASTIIPKKECAHEGQYVTAKTDATCTTAGSTTYYCPVEKTTHTEYSPMLGHTKGTVYSDTATCGRAGVITYYCTECHTMITENSPALKHEYKAVKTKAPTFTKDGYVKYECETCGDTYIEATDAYKAGSIKSITTTKTTAKITLNKGNATKYVVKYSTSKDMKNAKTVTTKTGSVKINELKKGTKYYFQVRTYNGSTYSAYTTVKGSTTKK